jgi:hypothetical protein
VPVLPSSAALPTALSIPLSFSPPPSPIVISTALSRHRATKSSTFLIPTTSKPVGNIAYLCVTGQSGVLTSIGGLNLANAILAAATNVSINVGGNMLQPIAILGLDKIVFGAGMTSTGQTIPKQPNQGVFTENGQDVTAQVVSYCITHIYW